MYSFFVLGLVPGTNIQLSFQAWLLVICLALLAALIVRRRLLYRTIAEALPVRVPLHATQLHRRG